MLKSLTARLASTLALYGGWGLLGISFLDATIFSVPLFNDLLLIHLAAQSPGRAPAYALGSTVGSVAGYCLVYALARGGGNLLRRGRPPEATGRTRRWLQRNDFMAIVVTSLLPPPAPFKPFVIGAGVLRMNAVRFSLAVLVGRGLRFLADAWLGARYGAQAEVYFKEHLARASLVAVALLLAVTVIYRAFSRRTRYAG